MTSRYTDARRAWVPNKKQGMVEIVYRKPPEYQSQTYVDYFTRSDDTMPAMAWKNYRDPTMWWMIAEMNPQIVCPDDVTFGTVVHIPTIRTST